MTTLTFIFFLAVMAGAYTYYGTTRENIHLPLLIGAISAGILTGMFINQVQEVERYKTLYEESSSY